MSTVGDELQSRHVQNCTKKTFIKIVHMEQVEIKNVSKHCSLPRTHHAIMLDKKKLYEYKKFV